MVTHDLGIILYAPPFAALLFLLTLHTEHPPRSCGQSAQVYSGVIPAVVSGLLTSRSKHVQAKPGGVLHRLSPPLFLLVLPVIWAAVSIAFLPRLAGLFRRTHGRVVPATTLNHDRQCLFYFLSHVVVAAQRFLSGDMCEVRGTLVWVLAS